MFVSLPFAVDKHKSCQQNIANKKSHTVQHILNPAQSHSFVAFIYSNNKYLYVYWLVIDSYALSECAYVITCTLAVNYK